ncbi:transcription initiation factor IIB [Dinochytrium kinnereticum]|nr:transcription initiation factor IIB [Dinochytrium kinnereticum]
MTFVSTTEQGPQRPTVDLSFKLICRDCRNPVPNIVENFKDGDLVCGDCGLVLGDRIIDTRSEWRTFSNDEGGDDPSRVGAAGDALLGGMNYLEATTISYKDGGSGAAKELSRVHGKVTNVKGEKSLLSNFRSIQTMCERMGLGKVVVDSAKQLFKRVEDSKILRGKTHDAIMAACIYIACRHHAVTRTFKEICNVTNVSKKEIGRCYKQLQQLFEKPQQVSLSSYIYRFSDSLDLNKDVQKAGLQVAEMVSDKGYLAGKSTISVVAASLYFAACMSDSPKPAAEVAKVAGCTEATLKNSYKILYVKREEIAAGLSLPKSIDALPS